MQMELNIYIIIFSFVFIYCHIARVIYFIIAQVSFSVLQSTLIEVNITYILSMTYF